MPYPDTPPVETRDDLTVAQERLNRGMQLTRADEIALDRAGNGDGAFNKEDLQIMEDRRNDTAFKQGMMAAGTAMVGGIFISEGAMQINAPDINGPFTMAAAGGASAPQSPAPANIFASRLSGMTMNS